MRYWAIVPAAGVGSRMLVDRPKQYLDLLGKPILLHTLERLSSVSRITGIVTCITHGDPFWPTLGVPAKVRTAEGGKERFFSVLNGLLSLRSQADSDDWVLVHDAARPCVRRSDIERLMDSLADHPVGGLLAMPVRDTLKRADTARHVTDTINRDQLWHALTPQMFRFGLLLEALQKVVADQAVITDDAQAIEYLGYQPVLVEGHADNLKITHPQDLALAELFLRQQLD